MLCWSLSGHTDSFHLQLLFFWQLYLGMLDFNFEMQLYKIRLHKYRSELTKVEIIWILKDELRVIEII